MSAKLGYPRSPQRCRLGDDADQDEGGEQNGRPGLGKSDCALDEIGPDYRRKENQSPIEQGEQEQGTDNSANHEGNGDIGCVLNEKRGDDCRREFSPGNKSENGNGNLLQEHRQQRAGEAEDQGEGQGEQGRWLLNKVRRELDSGGKANGSYA